MSQDRIPWPLDQSPDVANSANPEPRMRHRGVRAPRHCGPRRDRRPCWRCRAGDAGFAHGNRRRRSKPTIRARQMPSSCIHLRTVSARPSGCELPQVARLQNSRGSKTGPNPEYQAETVGSMSGHGRDDASPKYSHNGTDPKAHEPDCGSIPIDGPPKWPSTCRS